MKIQKWLDKNTASLAGRTIAVTGSTGGIGRQLCDYLASLGAALILVDRNEERSRALGEGLSSEYGVSVRYVRADLEDMASVAEAAAALIDIGIDVFIHNAGAYSIPRRITDSGYDNVFQINFASPYYMIRKLLPTLRARGGRVVAVSSIAHSYSKTDADDVDFSTRRKASRVYGNAKRYLMFSLYKLFEGERAAELCIAHPGISFTGITNHYPKIVFALIKHPMKVIFMKPRLAALSVLRGVFESTASREWIGPRVFGIWGLPKKRRVSTCGDAEFFRIGAAAEKIYSELEAKYCCDKL